MSTHPLTSKGQNAYAWYFVWSFAPLYAGAIVLSLLGAPASLLPFGQGVAWGFALWRLATRFFAGQRRAPLRTDASGIVLRAAVLSGVASTILQLAAASLTYGIAVLEDPLLIGTGLLQGMLFSYLKLRIFFIPILQTLLFSRWLDRNR